MKFKKGDTLKILKGKDQGKTGKVLKVIISPQSKSKDKIIIEGINLRYKHIRPKRAGEKGQRIMFPFALSVANAQLVCPKCGQPTRIGYQVLAKAPETTREKKQRVCKKCRAII
ncbi:50S ribosomal protein L24 [Candidatus Kuenenbacteria bacterium CG_4_9_14_3_um_filter_39_14]|uniref:Large ribosomal subunit protein uL24 n=7 Tax=Candidatus Kueneniibacteriota TaxID=1752740 RepID=A0A2M7IMH6_9BACT|nr:50S ribosomal protein L24 [Candidatus Kuenenbacteria bacterium]OIP56763.1 MAG: 50S ribosomal protein L24 [Candidatus Kuenenbacteria bacterium CG2_30_39_24]PIP28941.1 MAG: 50S ribosomal protein L24 [Candidatus Kuenenbacteria bacterium CG23_combo_of_CG06-09_8_20_14_all_39_39]PIP75303.1 MAG: 50S ribosomal protein L24 [Candidatus Kuenenbacteria bacterium CG22_combo_CG10-13_8_21_14_all_39_9]PIR81089.1 MAG: 50S ribosomal protein L24 [Candidatus Kuenenbacteria bacterium CG10_big_fil_rev_8_21_14_0_1